MAEYLKIPEVAQRLDVSEKTVRRYVKAGELPSVFIGGAYRVSEEDLEEYLENAKVLAGGDPGKGQAPLPLEQLPESERSDLERVLDGEKPRAFFSTTVISGAANNWLSTVGDSSTDTRTAFGIAKTAQDLESGLSTLTGDEAAWRQLSGKEKSEVIRVMKILEDVTARYISRVEEEKNPPAQLEEYRRFKAKAVELRRYTA